MGNRPKIDRQTKRSSLLGCSECLVWANDLCKLTVEPTKETGRGQPLYKPNVTSRNLWLIAILVGMIYWVGSLARSGVAFEELASLPKALIVATKGLFTALLAMSVFAARKGLASQMVGTALAISAVGDMLLVTVGSAAGGLAFAIAHLVSGYAYAKNRRDFNSAGIWMAAIAVPLIAVLSSYLVLRGSNQNILMSLFPLISGSMAALAILSRFPLWLTGFGAAIFVASDILFLADLGILHHSGELGFVTWASYAVGYAMVARGAAFFGTTQGNAAPN
jgi:YhhN family